MFTSLNKPAKLIIGIILVIFTFRLVLLQKNIDKPSVQGVSTIVTSTPTPSLIPIPTDTTTSQPTPTINPNLFLVTKVIDGDTFKIKIGDKEDAVRLIGIDTPEAVDPRKPVQCFGKEASAKAKELIEGKNVVLDSDPTQGDRDKYNRLLRYGRLENGTFINKKLIEDGYAFEYTYNIPYKYQTEFKEAQKQAEANKRGLWADNACPTSTSTLTPTKKPLSPPQPASPPAQTDVNPPTTNTSGSWACNCSKNCDDMASCDEAYFQLNTCGCFKRDGDNDGVPCENLCN